MTAVAIKQASPGRLRRAFLTFPWRIYRGDPLWVPPLLPERRKVIDPAHGVYFRRGEAEFYMAWRGREPVGTVCVAEDFEANAARATRECMIGFLEYVQDYAVFRALIEHATRWAESRGLNTLWGPFNLDYEDGYGLLVKGRDGPPALLCGHTPTYYQAFMERYGFQPERADNLAYAIDLVDTPATQRLARLADRLRAKGRITIRGADFFDWDGEIDRVHRLLNAALGHLPGSPIPWPREAVEAIVAPFRSIADPELILFAVVEGRTVGWMPAVPNLNEALIHANGLRHPWDYARLWWHMRRQTESLTVKSVLVEPAYWNRGVAAMLFDELFKRAKARGYQWADLSLTSDDNPQTPILATRMGATLYKRYRVYHLRLGRQQSI